MKTRSILIFLFITVISSFLLSFLFLKKVYSQVTSGDVVINEIMWMGTSVDATDEWIELHNTTANSIDLSGWVVERLGSGLGENITLPQGLSISSNGYFVIADKPAEQSILLNEPGYQTGSVSLTNTGEQLILKNSNGEIIDTANGTGGWHIGDNSQKKSMERNSNPGDGTMSQNWHIATTAVNLDPGVVDLATPGAPNSDSTVDAPTPSPTIELAPTTTPTIEPTATPSPSQTPTATPNQTQTPTPSPTLQPTITPSIQPDLSPIPTITPINNAPSCKRNDNKSNPSKNLKKIFRANDHINHKYFNQIKRKFSLIQELFRHLYSSKNRH